MIILIFFFNDTSTTEIYTLSLHDALPIYLLAHLPFAGGDDHSIRLIKGQTIRIPRQSDEVRSEEQTSELQLPFNLVCRLLLAKKKYITSSLLARADE